MRSRKLAAGFVLGAVFLAALCVTAQQSRPDPSELTARVDAVFAAFDKPGSPGCALGVARDGKMIYSRGYGMANLEHNIPLTSKTVFDIGSTSKQFTAASILLLAQQGKLTLDDDIRKYVAELPAYDRPITIRHMLHHISGLRDYLTLMSLAGTDFDGVTTAADALRIIARQKALNFSPGDEFLYSNSGFFLLSVIVERAGGKSLPQFARQNIFEPLGMNNSHFHDDHTMVVPGRATGYSPRPASAGGGFRVDMSGFEQTGDGAVYTTVEDLMLWDQNYYQPKVGGQQLLADLQTTGVLTDGEKITYARGLVVDKYRGLPIVSHGGSWAGYRAELLRFPEERFSVICLCNTGNSNPSALARQVADIFLAERLAAATAKAAPPAAAVPVQLSPDEMKVRTGLYRNGRTGALRRVEFRDGKLWTASFFGGETEMVPSSKSEFRVNSPAGSFEIVFQTARPSEPLRFHLKREAAKPESFEAVEKASPSAAELGAYAGRYFSEELDATYTVARDAGNLTVRVDYGQSRPLRPTYRDAFAVPGGLQMEFTRDAQGQVTGFAVQAGRVRDIRFVRLN